MLRASSLAQQLPRLQLKPSHTLLRWTSRPFFSASHLRRQLIAVDDKKEDGVEELQKENVEEQETELYVVQKPTYPAGRAWRRLPIQPVSEPDPKLHGDQTASPETAAVQSQRGAEPKMGSRQYLLTILGTTNSIEVAWSAYTSLLDLPRPIRGPHNIPLRHLHRFAFLLASARPKTRVMFLQMLSVMTAIRSTGGRLDRRWWNALIDLSARGWRGVGEPEYRVALQVFADMIEGREPGETFLRLEEEMGRSDVWDKVPLDFPRVNETQAPSTKEKPSLYSFNTLISIAARTKKPELVQQATSLLVQHSSIVPNRVTHLSLLNYFGAIRQLPGVRTTILKMIQQNLEIGLDGLNACMWAYALNDRVDVAVMIYRLLRHNSVPEVPSSSIDKFSATLKTEEHIDIPPGIHLNEITFHQTIQILAYAGDFKGALGVFSDFLSTKNKEVGAPLMRNPDGTLEPMFYLPTMTVYRAVFLGFARHGVPSYVPERLNDAAKLARERELWDRWSWSNLFKLFDTFMTHPPEGLVISRPTIYWIIVGFARTTNGNRAVLRYVWSRLEGKWPGPWGGEKHRLVRIREQLYNGEGARVDDMFFVPDFEQARRDKDDADSMLVDEYE